MKEDYTQPFWVGWNNPRFPYARYGYLPSEEKKCEQDLADRVEALENQVILMKQPQLTAKQNDTINQIKSGYLHLQRKVNELFGSLKKDEF